MICPNQKCLSSKNKVVESSKEGATVIRRRECKCCETRFNTCEVMVSQRGTRISSSDSVGLGRTRRSQRRAGIEAVVASMETDTNRAKLQAARKVKTARRRDQEDVSRYYSDEYVDTMVSDDDVKDLMELFGE